MWQLKHDLSIYELNNLYCITAAAALFHPLDRGEREKKSDLPPSSMMTYSLLN
jgi:hypothetical protein